MSDNTAQVTLRQRPAHFADVPLGACPPRTVRSLYVHVPFCNHKCHYCDFYSLVGNRDRTTAFTARLSAELASMSRCAAPLETVFFGGGTPTLLPADAWQTILARLHASFRLVPDAEFTVECNPETAALDLFEILAGGGVNRLSLGAQSFNPRHLATLDRIHSPESLPRALDLARRAGIRRHSVDLIYAIPGQTLEDWREDLERAIDLGTGHLSCYNLTYEPRTALTARLDRGLVEPVAEELEVEMFQLASGVLADAGFERYEVSNYARPGQACRHNLAYWRQNDWLAAGPSASGHAAGHRWKNTPHLDTYLTNAREGSAPIVDHEPPDPARAIRERIMTGLRLAEGLDTASLITAIETCAPEAFDRFQAALRRLRDRGWLVEEGSVLRLTERGILYADGAASELMLALV